MKYVITGINRLTGDRNIISSPAEKEDIERLIAKVRARKQKRPAYTYMKAEPLSVVLNRQSLYKNLAQKAADC